MNLKQSVRCQMQMDSRWIQMSVVFMGLSVFLRAVYYLGLTNFQDLSAFQLMVQLILPVVVAAVYLILIKGLNMNSPILLGILSGLYALDYLLSMEKGETVSAVLLAVNVAVFLATVFGYLYDTKPVVIAGILSMVYRVAFVDLVGYIFPLSEWHMIAYIPLLSNMCAVLAIGLLSPALQLTHRRKQPVEKATESTSETLSQRVTIPEAELVPEETAEPVAEQEASEECK